MKENGHKRMNQGKHKGTLGDLEASHHKRKVFTSHAAFTSSSRLQASEAPTTRAATKPSPKSREKQRRPRGPAWLPAGIGRSEYRLGWLWNFLSWRRLVATADHHEMQKRPRQSISPAVHKVEVVCWGVRWVVQGRYQGEGCLWMPHFLSQRRGTCMSLNRKPLWHKNV